MTTLQPGRAGGRDPRRSFTMAQRAEISARQHHLCECGADLIEGEWEAHHVIRHADGGPTRTEYGVGLCRPCHLAAEIVLPEFHPRDWQVDAHPTILDILLAGQFATLNVAPGGGKTLFAGWVARTMLDQGAIERIVIAVPYVAICEQWYETLSSQFGIYLGVNIASERRREQGVVVTYPGIPNKFEQLAQDTRDAKTLWILDEVHHLSVDERGGASAWAYNIGQIVGQVSQPRTPVLNLTGTLFRSKRGERIPTITYTPLPSGTIESAADYTIDAAKLIKQGVLRTLRVLGFDQEMVVTGLNLRENATIDPNSVRAVDLDAMESRERNQILAGLIRTPKYIDGMVRQTIERLGEAAGYLDKTAVCKGLIIADDQKHAKLIHSRLQAMGYGPQTYIAISENKEANENIRRFRTEQRSAILIAVQKVTEGFDVPDVAVLTYLNTWCAPLFINQMVGRAMRVTKLERELDRRLMATILIPDDPQIREAFADVLVGAMRMLEAPPEPCQNCGRRDCACPLYRREPLGTPLNPREPGADLDDVLIELLNDPELTSSNVNGHQINNMLIRQEFVERLIAKGMSPMQADLLTAVYEETREDKPWAFLDSQDEEIEEIEQ